MVVSAEMAMYRSYRTVMYRLTSARNTTSAISALLVI